MPTGGKGRVDSPLPRTYSVLYVGSTPECAIAECFGAFDVWDRVVIEAKPATPLVPRSRFALAAYDLPDDSEIRNLDDASALVSEHLRPSNVVTRDRAITQAWAAKIHARDGTPAFRGGHTMSRRGSRWEYGRTILCAYRALHASFPYETQQSRQPQRPFGGGLCARRYEHDCSRHASIAKGRKRFVRLRERH